VSDSARWQISDLAYLYEQTKCTYFATACRKSVDPKVRRARSLCRLRSPAIAEPASITKARRRARAGPCLMYQVPCCYLLARPQSCRRRPLQLGESTSEAVVALFLAVWCRALDYRSQVFLPTRPPPIPYPHPGLTLACVSTHYAAVHCHRRPPPCPATHLSLHARSYRPSGTAPAANHLSGTHARDRRHRYIYTPPELNRYITLHYIASNLHERIRKRHIHILDCVYRTTCDTEFYLPLALPTRPFFRCHKALLRPMELTKSGPQHKHT
jgi:hypothetical protein